MFWWDGKSLYLCLGQRSLLLSPLHVRLERRMHRKYALSRQCYISVSHLLLSVLCLRSVSHPKVEEAAAAELRILCACAQLTSR
eukprot:COSAG02_NODE_740_length_17807_cov_30.958987_7_plen_84_part_00